MGGPASWGEPMAGLADLRAREEEPFHARPGLLSDFILGSQDGLVNVLGVLLGVAVASQNPRIIIAAGLAATFAESISMAAVAYTSTLARRDHYVGERERELREMRDLPDAERAEVRTVLEAWGLEGETLDTVAKAITSNDKAWLEFMMAHELNLVPVKATQPLRSAAVVGVSAILGSIVPLVPFLFLPIFPLGAAVSIAMSAVVLFALGAYKARTTVGRPSRSGLQIAVIGLAAAAVGFLVGLLFQAPAGP